MTKSGDIAGPQYLEHIVDVVLYMEVVFFLKCLNGKFSISTFCDCLFPLTIYSHHVVYLPLSASDP